MPRQPLLSKDRNAGISLGPGFLENRPKATALIGQCIALWTEVELQTAVLLSRMLGTDAPPVAALYFSLTNERAKREAMLAIAEQLLSDEKIALFKAWTRLKKSLEKERNDLAHGLYGITDIDQEGVLWISTGNRIQNIIESLDALEDNVRYTEIMKKVKSQVYIYTISDLEQIKNDFISLHYITRDLISALYAPHEPTRVELYRLLSQRPLLEKFVSQTSSNPKIDP